MLERKHEQFSLYYTLYDRIPENHLLKKINKTVDFNFIYEMLGDSYNKHYGRPAKNPVMLVKLLLLKYLYNLSDTQVINETDMNLAYKWFVGLSPEDNLPNPSLLAKFRRNKLKKTMLNDIFEEIARQCIEKGLIKPFNIKIAPAKIMSLLSRNLK